jgi:hypothetical protein
MTKPDLLQRRIDPNTLDRLTDPVQRERTYTRVEVTPIKGGVHIQVVGRVETPRRGASKVTHRILVIDVLQLQMPLQIAWFGKSFQWYQQNKQSFEQKLIALMVDLYTKGSLNANGI